MADSVPSCRSNAKRPRKTATEKEDERGDELQRPPAKAKAARKRNKQTPAPADPAPAEEAGTFSMRRCTASSRYDSGAYDLDIAWEEDLNQQRPGSTFISSDVVQEPRSKAAQKPHLNQKCRGKVAAQNLQHQGPDEPAAADPVPSRRSLSLIHI